MTRDQLVALARSAGVHISPHSLLRWVDAGLLPTPRRRAVLGRGKGTRYPLYPPTTALQAVCIAASLRVVRNLDEAGWNAWVVVPGFPLTKYVRDLMLEELRSEQRVLRCFVKKDRRGRRPNVERMARRSSSPELSYILREINPKGRSTVLRMISELQLGSLAVEDYSSDDLLLSQDAAVRLFEPGVVDEKALPDAVHIARGLREQAARSAIPSKIAILRRIDDDALCRIRDEAQGLHRIFGASLGRDETVIGRGDFLQYLANRFENDSAEQGVIGFMKALGAAYPPQSQVGALFRCPADAEGLN